jgi:FkbM family methyltransferase
MPEAAAAVSLGSLPKEDLAFSIIRKAFRLISPGTRGKTRLANLLLSRTLRARTSLVHDRYGNQFVLPNSLEPVGLFLWMDGTYEPEVLQFLEHHVTRDSVVLDVGANIGAFTIPLARRARKVIAIEPSPQVLPFLKRNVELNRLTNVEIVECAASKPGSSEVAFYVPPSDHFGMGSSAPQFNVAPIIVPAKSIDEILAERRVSRVDVIKMDVEGYEAHAFLGAKGLLTSPAAPLVVFESTGWPEERAFPGRAGWAQEILMDAGYQLWTLASYLRRGTPLKRPIPGGDTIVGFPRHMPV